jgi:23S rRNA (adenine2503-C2)-methyltransferase
MKYFLDLEPKQLKEMLESWKESPFRAVQLMEWVYKKGITAFGQCSSLSASLREKLAAKYSLYALTLVKKTASKKDGTVRYDFKTADDLAVSAVFLPRGNKNSVCISTQSGCSIGCCFCATGKGKFGRNLTRGEIVEQILRIRQDTGKDIDGVLLMGMGEPLLNYDNVVSALHVITDTNHLGIGRRHVTLSTVGIAPRIKDLGGLRTTVRLAISLHAPDDETRRKIIPAKVPYTTKEILNAGLEYANRTKSHLTLEYILISGVNDTQEHARKLLELFEECNADLAIIKINLIPFNPVEKSSLKKPTQKAIELFESYLLRRACTVIVREPKGLDIGAACGQLGV